MKSIPFLYSVLYAEKKYGYTNTIFNLENAHMENLRESASLPLLSRTIGDKKK